MNEYIHVVDLAKKYLLQSVKCNDVDKAQNLRKLAIKEYEKLLSSTDITDYLLIDSKPAVPENVYIDSYFSQGTLYKIYAETQVQKQIENLKKNSASRNTQEALEVTQENDWEHCFHKSLSCFATILRVKFEHEFATKQIVSVYTYLCFLSQNNLNKCLQYLQESLMYAPENETIHYNLGHIYTRLNKLELALIHYKLSNKLLQTKLSETLDGDETDDLRKLILNNYNGIAGVHKSIKNWPEALFYLRKAEVVDENDPDIQNQLGSVYTEMRRTDLAEVAYLKAINNYDNAFISTDKTFLKAELYLNYGHMHSYNGNNEEAIKNYDKSLQVCPKFILPFQNKLMNISYIFDQLEDKMYITKLHKRINKLYTKGSFYFPPEYFSTPKINIGIVSGDFVDHPVSFFISTFLKNFDNQHFNVTCYSESIINTKLFNDNLQFKLIKNMNAQSAATMIHKDKIHILLDLAGHTALNRLDIFALKPCPTQITYIGYPFSTGLNEMDYRITDSITDNMEVSQPYYTEKLVTLDNCFLCYDPTVLPMLDIQPMSVNGYLTIGCFNRLNKMTDPVIKVFNDILLHLPQAKFVFKTKALINDKVRLEFLNKFDAQVQDRIVCLDCTILHEQHLQEYNKIDVAIDTFPYSGTTTSCEALTMGVPVFTLYDSEYFFHPQNVTASILRNSNLDNYVVNSVDELYIKLQELQNKSSDTWSSFKTNIRSQFLGGKVCDKNAYLANLTKLLCELHQVSKNKS
jgi:predicted O-linked N-acetylglucosamine transferase (SPINDLY family)